MRELVGWLLIPALFLVGNVPSIAKARDDSRDWSEMRQAYVEAVQYLARGRIRKARSRVDRALKKPRKTLGTTASLNARLLSLRGSIVSKLADEPDEWAEASKFFAWAIAENSDELSYWEEYVAASIREQGADAFLDSVARKRSREIRASEIDIGSRRNRVHIPSDYDVSWAFLESLARSEIGDNLGARLVLERNRDSLECLGSTLLAEAQHRDARIEDAVRLLARITPKCKTGSQFRLELLRARLAGQFGDLDEARRHYNNAVVVGMESAAVPMRELALLEREVLSPPDYGAKLRRAAERNPDDAQSWLAVGMQLQQYDGNPTLAIRQLISEQPRRTQQFVGPVLLSALGELQSLDRRHRKRAMKRLRMLALEHDECVECWWAYAIAELSIGERKLVTIEKCLAHLRRASRFPHEHILASGILDQLGKMSEEERLGLPGDKAVLGALLRIHGVLPADPFVELGVTEVQRELRDQGSRGYAAVDVAWLAALSGIRQELDGHERMIYVNQRDIAVLDERAVEIIRALEKHEKDLSGLRSELSQAGIRLASIDEALLLIRFDVAQLQERVVELKSALRRQRTELTELVDRVREENHKDYQEIASLLDELGEVVRANRDRLDIQEEEISAIERWREIPASEVSDSIVEVTGRISLGIPLGPFGRIDVVQVNLVALIQAIRDRLFG